MKSLCKRLVAAALLGLVATGPAQADDTPPAFPFAATGFISGGGAFLDYSNCNGPGCSPDIASIVGGGDFVIPLTGYWNLQMGGAWRYDTKTDSLNISLNRSRQLSNIEFQGSGIGFWRDPTRGLFGIEVGLASVPVDYVRRRTCGRGSRCENNETFVKLGAVAEYYFSELVTIGGFGGVLLPLESTSAVATDEIDDGFYAGGHLTYYATNNFAATALVRYSETSTSLSARTADSQALRVGAEARYLSSMPGVELFAYGGYTSCESGRNRRRRLPSATADGVELLAGVRIRLGGQDGSLASIDRSNTIDTRAWGCEFL